METLEKYMAHYRPVNYMETLLSTFNPPKLRPYQLLALRKFLEHRKITIVAPTGTGKTIVALAAIKVLKLPTAIIVPTEALMRQWKAKLEKYGLRSVGLFYGGLKEVRPVTIFIYNSAAKHVDVVKRFKFIVLDEVHHLAANTFKVILLAVHQAEYAMGLTASPERLDGMHRLYFKFLPPLYNLPLSVAKKFGWVSPLKVIEAPASMTPKERYKYMEYEETITKAYRVFQTLNPARLRKIYERERNPLALAAVKALVLRKMLLAKVMRKYEVLYRIVQLHRNEKILVFSESIESIETAKRYLRYKGVKCMVYHSEIPKRLREKILKLWEKGYFNVLLSVKALEEGIDVPEVGVGVIIASGTTKRQYIQRIGRLVRPRPGKVAKIYIIYCPGTVETKHAKNIKRLLLTNL